MELVLLVDEVVLERSDRSLHVKDAFLLSLKAHGSHGHKVTHYCLGGDDTQLLVALLFALEHDGHLLAARVALDQLVVLLVCELQTCHFIV